MPINPVRPDRKAPARKARVRAVPDCANDSATLPSGFSTWVEVKKTRIASGTMMTAMVLNCRRRKAVAPSWMALAISIMVGVP
jgi:hypothetical protein